MKTVTTKAKAWIVEHSSISPADLFAGERVDELQFHSGDMRKYGWTHVGEAEISVTLISEKTMVSEKIDSLREQATQIRAEATAKCTQIESQINDLLALSFDGSTGEQA